MRHIHKYYPKNVNTFKKQLLAWSQAFDEIVWLDSNSFKSAYSNFDAVLAVGALTSISTDYHQAFQNLKEYQTNTKDWIFGYLSYDLKNDVEALVSNNFDGLEFPELVFFQPKKLFFIKEGMVELHYLTMVAHEMETDLSSIQSCVLEAYKTQDKIKVKLRINKDEYHSKVEKLLEHIHRGDVYEANFCQEFYAEEVAINPLQIYNNLNQISNPPFATFLKFYDKYLLSASPERYLKKTGNSLLSQPIKGTSRRSEDPIEDNQLKAHLKADEKERSENIMIVDLVRNDLSRTAMKGSVTVEELCEVYTFQQVHQMISTITSKISNDVHPVDVIKTTFPMGSMTGAPKVSAMTIIEQLEETKRGLYSGAVGYFSPAGDFDFNVVIRSILYNKTKQYVSYSVGGAITAKSEPAKEYEECLVKAKAMREVLEN
ncbi:aminobenzoate synthetase [Mangrovimonas yunxiaonensis]|uniref:Aminobenzoate synthetase n=1 Tax=Mangrovimonas yunxiaonensis TaxID=1197477 RepID=A0A084TJW6_9FLAO|nr:aminodeoxychorismate synthase component I [Mangrovimonas yunxiaonensis]KFB01002.1 aminobenzoate synthetase [Mangrovimonas yunxiaonensis]GGH43093.1 para-aminobenzoate synthase [Mangrovimonas yunxiaonensis]